MIHILDKVTSTNIWAFDNLIRIYDSVLSFEQSKGRGRDNRSWSSSLGGFYFSFLSESHPLLPFISGISIVQALPDIDSQLRLKWPNDIILNGKKLGGILCEDDGRRAIVGIGLNFDTTPSLPNSTSLSDKNYNIDKNIFLNDFLRIFKVNFDITKEDIISSYSRYDCLLGNQITWDTGSGVANSVNDDGSLHVITADGNLDLYSEDVHVEWSMDA